MNNKVHCNVVEIAQIKLVSGCLVNSMAAQPIVQEKQLLFGSYTKIRNTQLFSNKFQNEFFQIAVLKHFK